MFVVVFVVVRAAVALVSWLTRRVQRQPPPLTQDDELVLAA